MPLGLIWAGFSNFFAKLALGLILASFSNFVSVWWWIFFFLIRAFLFLREFQLMVSGPNDSSLSLDQDTNQFLV